MPHLTPTGMREIPLEEFTEFTELPIQPDGEDPGDFDTDEEYRSRIRRMVDEALNWNEEFLEPEQRKATEFYKTFPYGDEEEGRSQVVTSEVRDTVRMILPSLMRVFFGSEDSVEFKPRGLEDRQLAKLRTKYINYIVREDNPGFLAFWAAFKDALIRKMGILKWVWDEEVVEDGDTYTGLDQNQVNIMLADPTVEVLSVIEEKEEVPALVEPVFPDSVDFGNGEVIPPIDVNDRVIEPPGVVGTGQFSVQYKRRVDSGNAIIAAVPPEEFIFSPSARSLEDARMVGHIRDMPADELRAMGVPEELLERVKGRGRRLRGFSSLEEVRRLDGDIPPRFEDEDSEETRLVRFHELYVRIDKDEDGISELRKILAVGDTLHIWVDDPTDHVPFAVFGPDPEPHTLVGDSVADLMMQIQRIKSAITRGMLDSLTQAIMPATEVVEGEVNMGDVLNKEVSRVIRVRRPGMMREAVTPFVGREALPVLQYLDTVGEKRSGLPAEAAGIDADALQSTTAAAVQAVVQSSAQQIEMIARIFAETGMKQLYSGLLRLIVAHQDTPRIVRLFNEDVEVDPRTWEADADVQVNLAPGATLIEDKMRILGLIAEKQEQLLLNGAPLVGLSEYRTTLARIVELAGFPSADEFFKPFGPQEEQAFAQAQAQQPQPPSDTEALIQIETAKIQARSQEEVAKLQLEAAKLQLEREKLAQQTALKTAELEIKRDEGRAKIDIDAARAETEQGTATVDAINKLSTTQVGGDEPQ